MHDQRVGPVVEFLADPVHALLSRPGRRRLQPLVGNQCSDVFDLLGCGFVVDPSSDRRHHRVSPKSLQHSGVPVIGLHQQVPVALKIGGETRNGFLQPQLFREMVANRGETGPHPYAVGVTTGLFGGGLHGCDAALQRLRREVCVQDDVIEHPAAQRQCVGPECHQGEPDVLIEVRIEKKDGVLAHWAVVVEDHLAVPEPAHDLGPILHLCGRHRRNAECPVDRGDTAPYAESESAAGQPVHRCRPRSGDQRMAGVVIGCGGGDLHPAGHRTRRPNQ
jgi:hypothetical protein